jgi:hypothetical protein
MDEEQEWSPRLLALPPSRAGSTSCPLRGGGDRARRPRGSRGARRWQLTRLLLDASVLLSAAVARPGTPTSLLMDAVEDGKIEWLPASARLTR